MTTENKQNILDYVSGMFTTTQKEEKEIFLEQEEVDRSNWLNYLPEHWNNFRFEGIISPNEKTTPLGVMYGGFIDTDNNVCGIIVLIDQDFKPVKTIYEYDSGTKLRYIQYMKQAEDGTFYFVDDTAFTFSQRQQVMTSQKRFVMTNNFTIATDYAVKLRTSYIFSGDYVNFYCKNMFKDPNSSHYIFFGSAVDSSTPQYDYKNLKIFSLKVNVGEANTWTMYVNETQRIFGSAIATFEGENVKFRCLTTNNLLNNNNLVLYSKTYTGSPTTSNITFYTYKPYVDDFDYKKQSVFLDFDNVYFVQNNQRWGTSGTAKPKYIGLYRYNIPETHLLTIYEEYLGDYDYCNKAAIYIDRCNTDIYVQYNNNVSNSSPVKADYYFQRLVNDVWKPILIDSQAYFEREFRSLYIKANYNLLQVYLYGVNPRIVSAWYYYSIKEDYNAINYNGEPYVDYDSQISRKGRLYANNKVIFARNLYNRTTYNNSTTSTIQIPNTYFNDIPITAKRLLSNTNSTIDYDTHQFTKNIYENVLLNFIDSIYVIDEDTDTLYPTSANYVNQNINTGTKNNYEITQIGKVRINYADGDMIMPIVWTGTTIKEAKFTIYVSSDVDSIDFLSEDETFTYITKKYNNLEVGKYYTITQKIRIE